MGTNPAELILIEDNPNDVELTLHALREHKLASTIHVVRDGVEALDFFFGADQPDQKSIKLILLDIKLPKIDGLEVLSRLKSHPATKAIPVVILTSSNQERDILQSYDIGANSYIVKPVNFHQFTDVIRELGLYWMIVNQPPVVS
jgi:two-component system, response regulator